MVLIQFQNISANKFIFSHCPCMLSFTSAFRSRNTLLQFIISHLQYLKNNKIVDEKQSVDNAKEEEFTQFKDAYKSKHYYKHIRNIHNKHSFLNGNLTSSIPAYTNTFTNKNINVTNH